jgi:hypothetical protein
VSTTGSASDLDSPAKSTSRSTASVFLVSAPGIAATPAVLCPRAGGAGPEWSRSSIALARARDTFRYPGAWKASSEIPGDTLVAWAVILVPSGVEVDANSSTPSSEKHHTSVTCERPVAEKQVADERALVRVPERITVPSSETPIRSRIRLGSVTSGPNAVQAVFGCLPPLDRIRQCRFQAEPTSSDPVTETRSIRSARYSLALPLPSSRRRAASRGES